jgi:AcrR family transcriptional regulator
MASRRDWLDAGLVILAEQGAPAVTIERLTERLGLSKGSFYHHFKGMPEFKTALLAHFETERTTRFIEEAERAPAGSPGGKLRRLTDLVLTAESGPELEIAVRAWASQDDEVHAVQGRIDRARVEYLRDLCRASGTDPGVGQALYLIVIGAGQIVPPISGRELRHAFELVTRTTDLGRTT